MLWQQRGGLLKRGIGRGWGMLEEGLHCSGERARVRLCKRQSGLCNRLV